MAKLKINSVKATKGHRALCVKVLFEASEESFGRVGKYTTARSLTIPLEAFKDEVDAWERLPLEKKTYRTIKDEHPNSLYTERVPVLGQDSIIKVGPKSYSYEEFVVDSAITRACVGQLMDMKNAIDNKLGRVPSEYGCFCSGDVLSDFIGILETLSRFWD